MNVDPALIEKITKLVLSELQGHERSSTSTAYSPLTQEEIRRWNQISASIYSTERLEGAVDAAPLTDDEIRRWNEITTSFHTSSNSDDASCGSVKFHRTYS